jgi:hypothetical protein
MKKILGIFLITLPFISIIAFLMIIDGYEVILISLGISLFLIISLFSGVYLLFNALEE